MVERLPKPANDSEAPRLEEFKNDPHDEWSQEAFETHEDKRAKLKETVDALTSVQTQPPTVVVPETAPDSPVAPKQEEQGQPASDVEAISAKPPKLDAEGLAAVRAEAAGLGKERTAMLEAEREYLTALKSEGKKSRAGQSEGTATLEAKYNIASLAFNSALEARVNSHIGQEKFQKSLSKMSPEHRAYYTQEFANKYRRMFVSKDIIDRGAKSMEEVLGRKEKGALEKGLAWYSKNVTARLEKRLGKKGARALRILGGATAGAGIGALTGGVAFGLGFGRRVLSSVIGAPLGAMAGHAAGTAYGEYTTHRLKKSREAVADDATDIAKKRRAYGKWNKEAVATKRRRVEIATAMLVAGGVSLESAQALAQVEAVQSAAADLPPDLLENPAYRINVSYEFDERDAPETADMTPIRPQPEVATVEQPYIGDERDAPETADMTPIRPQPEAATVVSHEETPEVITTLVFPTVHVRSGLGWESMVNDLQDMYKGRTFPEDSDMAKLLATSPDEMNIRLHVLAQQHGFYKDGHSMLVGKDAIMTTNEQGHILFAQHEKDLPITETPINAPTTPDVQVVNEQNVAEVEVTRQLNQDSLEKSVSPAPQSNIQHEAPPAPPTDSYQQPSSSTLAEGPSALGGEISFPPQPDNLENFIATYKNEAHIYANAKNELFVYGGSGAKDLVQKFLAEHPKQFVDVPSTSADGEPQLIRYTMVNDVLATEPRTTNFFESMFGAKFVEPPPTSTFTKLVA